MTAESAGPEGQGMGIQVGVTWSIASHSIRVARWLRDSHVSRLLSLGASPVTTLLDRRTDVTNHLPLAPYRAWRLASAATQPTTTTLTHTTPPSTHASYSATAPAQAASTILNAAAPEYRLPEQFNGPMSPRNIKDAFPDEPPAFTIKVRSPCSLRAPCSLRDADPPAGHAAQRRHQVRLPSVRLPGYHQGVHALATEPNKSIHDAAS